MESTEFGHSVNVICPHGHVFEPSFCVWGVIVGIPRRCDGMGQGAIGSPIRKFLIEWNVEIRRYGELRELRGEGMKSRKR